MATTSPEFHKALGREESRRTWEGAALELRAERFVEILDSAKAD